MIKTPRIYLTHFSKLFLSISLVVLTFLLAHTPTFASMCGPTFPVEVPFDQQFTISFDLSSISNPVFCNNNPSNQICYKIAGCQTNNSTSRYCSDGILLGSSFSVLPNQSLSGNNLSSSFSMSRSAGQNNEYWLFRLEQYNPATGATINACGSQEFRLQTPDSSSPAGRPRCDDGTFRVVGLRGGAEVADYTLQDSLRLKGDGHFTANFPTGGLYRIVINQGSNTIWRASETLIVPFSGNGRLHFGGGMNFDIPIGNLGAGTYSVVVTDANVIGSGQYCSYPFRVSTDGDNELDTTTSQGLSYYKLCNQATTPETKAKCCQCTTGDASCSAEGIEPTSHIWTAIGCIESTPTSIVNQIITIGLSIAGSLALLLILAAGFMFATSSGDPKKTTEAKELLTAAIVGLLFIIFSVTILQFIGVSILRIPGLGNG